MLAKNIENLKTLKCHAFKKTDVFIVYSKFSHEYKKIFKEEESIEVLKILGWITRKYIIMSE